MYNDTRIKTINFFSNAFKSPVALTVLQCNVVCVTCISMSLITSLKNADKCELHSVEYYYLAL